MISFNKTLNLINLAGEEKDHEILVKITHATEGDPGCMYMANGDPGWPPEPPDVEWEIWLERGKRERPLPNWCKFVDQKLEKEITDAAYQALIDEENNAAEAAAELRYDSMRDS